MRKFVYSIAPPPPKKKKRLHYYQTCQAHFWRNLQGVQRYCMCFFLLSRLCYWVLIGRVGIWSHGLVDEKRDWKNILITPMIILDCCSMLLDNCAVDCDIELHSFFVSVSCVVKSIMLQQVFHSLFSINLKVLNQHSLSYNLPWA